MWFLRISSGFVGILVTCTYNEHQIHHFVIKNEKRANEIDKKWTNETHQEKDLQKKKKKIKPTEVRKFFNRKFFSNANLNVNKERNEIKKWEKVRRHTTNNNNNKHINTKPELVKWKRIKKFERNTNDMFGDIQIDVLYFLSIHFQSPNFFFSLSCLFYFPALLCYAYQDWKSLYKYYIMCMACVCAWLHISDVLLLLFCILCSLCSQLVFECFIKNKILNVSAMKDEWQYKTTTITTMMTKIKENAHETNDKKALQRKFDERNTKRSGDEWRAVTAAEAAATAAATTNKKNMWKNLYNVFDIKWSLYNMSWVFAHILTLLPMYDTYKCVFFLVLI